MRHTDFEVPLSWGHVSGVTWGNESGFPVLCLHGMQDNCMTFERLIPLLPKRFYWVAIDLPGHGKSSPYESGNPIEFTFLVYTVKMVIDHFKWNKIYLMGHSLGAQLSSFIAALFPELIVKAVFIDGLVPPFKDPEVFVSTLRKKFVDNALMEASLSRKTPPSYSFEAAVNRMITHRPGHIAPEAAKALVKRSLVVSGDGFRFSTDQRYKFVPAPILTFEQCMNVITSIKCPCLLIIAQESLKAIEDGHGLNYYSPSAVKALNSFSNFSCKMIDGNHNVHMNDPEGVAAFILPFFDDTKSSL